MQYSLISAAVFILIVVYSLKKWKTCPQTNQVIVVKFEALHSGFIIIFEHMHRSSHPGVFFKKLILENLAKVTEKQLCQSLFFNGVAGLSPQLLWKRDSGTGLQLFLKKCTLAGVFNKEVFFTGNLRVATSGRSIFIERSYFDNVVAFWGDWINIMIATES